MYTVGGCVEKRYKFKDRNQRIRFGKQLSERKINGSVHMIDLMDLKKLGLWQEYEKEANPDYSIEELVTRYPNGGLYGWVVFDNDNNEVTGFVLAVTTDYNLKSAILITNMYIRPRYRLTNVDALLYEGAEILGRMIKAEYVYIMVDDIRIAKWVLRRYPPDDVAVLLARKI